MTSKNFRQYTCFYAIQSDVALQTQMHYNANKLELSENLTIAPLQALHAVKGQSVSGY